MNRSDFTFKADELGYMIYYKGICVGGQIVKEAPVHQECVDRYAIDHKLEATQVLNNIINGTDQRFHARIIAVDMKAAEMNKLGRENDG